MSIRPDKVKCEFDSARDVNWGGCTFLCRTISAHGWRMELIGPTLLTLQRYANGSGSRSADFSLLLRDAGLMCVEVGARTAQEMGISDYQNVLMIPEAGYLDTVIDVYGLQGRL